MLPYDNRQAWHPRFDADGRSAGPTIIMLLGEIQPKRRQPRSIIASLRWIPWTMRNSSSQMAIFLMQGPMAFAPCLRAIRCSNWRANDLKHSPRSGWQADEYVQITQGLHS